jgi:hypothetical protein
VYKVGLVIYPVSYNPNEPLKGSDYLEWRAYVKEEVRNTANHIRRLSLFEFLNNEPWANNLYAQRLDRINKLEDSIGMESAVYQALEVLSSTTKN